MDREASSSTSPRVPPSRRRDKQQLSCVSCRQKKVKCDRQRPCHGCQVRGFTCTYPPINPASARPRSVNSRSTLADRLLQLETMLTSVADMTGGGGGPTAILPSSPRRNPSSSSGVTAPINPSRESNLPEPGKLRIDSTETIYVSGAHWTAILENVSEMREYIQRHDQAETPEDSARTRESTGSIGAARESREGPELFSGFIPEISKAELVNAIPDRAVVDRLVYRYFNCCPLGPFSVHGPSFLREYEDFWANPLQVDTMWLALLYGIMCFASYSESGSADRSKGDWGPGRGGPQPPYLRHLIQCLVLGDFTCGGKYSVVALFHYLLVEHLRRPDAVPGNWLLLGMILRLALRMGYHRDPSRFPELSPMEGELRRRLWMACYSSDLLISAQMGVPRMIKEGQWDTRAPRNLFDTDFDENSKELPPSRPLTEMTSVAPFLHNFALVKIIAQISDMTLSTTEDPNSDPAAEVDRLDRLLRATYESIPDSMKFTSMSNSILAPPQNIMRQVVTSALFQKGLITLHRWRAMSRGAFVAPGANAAHNRALAPEIANSVQICVQAALKTLEYQYVMHSEMQPNGVLSGTAWMLSSSLSHEYLTATSVLCTYLYRTVTGVGSVEDANALIQADDQLTAVKQSLIRAGEIWKAQSAVSKDAGRVAATVDALMGKLDKVNSESRNDYDAVVPDIPIEYLPYQVPGPNEDDNFFLSLGGMRF